MAQISSGGPVGILPGQSMFETDSTREGMLDARESFVRMVNDIFTRTAIAVERPDAATALDTTTPIPQHLIWRQATGERHVETPPKALKADDYLKRFTNRAAGRESDVLAVYSIEERDSLLADPTFAEALRTSIPRVLVNGLANEVPQWSVWDAVLPAPGTDDEIASLDPETVYSLAKAYDYPAPGEAMLTKAERNLLTLTLTEEGGLAPGSRVLVEGDASTNGFWTIWEYAPGSADSDDNGFVLRLCQTYRTKDFWDFIDWFAEGYSLASPPVVTYATAAARNANENPFPKTKFVRLDDDGNGRWVWTVYADGAWNIVARQNGTIRLSEKLYDRTRDIISTPPKKEELRRMFNREGSWELRSIINALRDGTAFSDLEINEVFFSILHFVHSQQDQVPWAFKTSFLNIGGYNESLRAVPVQPVDNTQNLLDYIEEVKPYRVKVREFTRVVTPDVDVVPAHVTDFDLPPYYDLTTGKHRILSISNAADLEIIKNNSPWKDWYENYQKPVREVEYYDQNTFNPVRQMNIRMDFDRVDHMPIIAEETFTYSVGDETQFDTIEPLTDRLVEVYINRVRVKSSYVGAQGNTVFLTTTPPDGAEVHVVIRQGLSFTLAADRIQRFYDPANRAAVAKNLRALMGLDPSINVLTGGALSDNSLNDYTTKVLAGAAGEEEHNTDPHYGLADPNKGPDRPQELIVAGSAESLSMLVSDGEGSEGGPDHFIQHFSVEEPDEFTEEMIFNWGTFVPDSNEAVIVFRDGYRAIPGVDYFILSGNRIRVNVIKELEPSARYFADITVRIVGPSIAKVHVQKLDYDTDLTWTLTTPTDDVDQTFNTIVDATFDDAIGARRLVPEADYTVVNGVLTITREDLNPNKPVLATTFTGSALFGMTTSVFQSNTSGNYPVTNSQGERRLWSSLSGVYGGSLVGEADTVTDPEFNFEMTKVTHADAPRHAYPVSISTDGTRAIYWNTNGSCNFMDTDTGALMHTYNRQKFETDFDTSHPGHNLTHAFVSSMDDLPGTNYVMVGMCLYGSGFVTAFMVYEIKPTGLVLYGSRICTTEISSDILALGFDIEGNICLSLALESIYFERPALITLPKIEPGNDLWQSHTWNGSSTVRESDITYKQAPASEEYFMSSAYTTGRTGGKNGGGFIVPLESGPRWYFYVSSGRIHYNLNSTNGRWAFAYNEGLTKPNGFLAYMDFNETTPIARVCDPAIFDLNGPPFADDGYQRDGTPDPYVRPTPGINGGNPHSTYTDQMQASPLVDDAYDGKFVVSFHKEYNGPVNAPEGMAIKAVLFYFDPMTGLFEYFKEAEGDTVDTVVEYGYNTSLRHNYRKVGPTVFWARDTGDVWELFGDYDADFISAAQFGKFKPETIIIPNSKPVVFTNFEGVLAASANTFLVSMARPATDLMAPKEVGDYDAVPLNNISHDVGVVGGSEIEPISGERRTVHVMRHDAWEFIRWQAAGGVLAAPVLPEDTSIVIMTSGGGGGGGYEPYPGWEILQECSGGTGALRAVSSGFVVGCNSYYQDADGLAGDPMADEVYMFNVDTDDIHFAFGWPRIHPKVYLRRTTAPKPGLPVANTNAPALAMPFVEPTLEKVSKKRKDTKTNPNAPTKRLVTEPGVVWINGERIEFFEYEITNGRVILSQLRRGTHGTRISAETRNVARHTGNGSTKVFSLSGETSVLGLEVVTYEGLKNADGSPIIYGDYTGYDVFQARMIGKDYTARVVNGAIVVTFVNAPANGVPIILAKSKAPQHNAGTAVHDGRNIYDIRPDRDLGGQTYY